MQLDVEFQYFILFATILLLPKMLLRFRIPAALSALFLGVMTSFFLGWFEEDQLLLMLSRLGITSLFLFAGMEVDVTKIREDAEALTKHLLKGTALIVITGLGIMNIFDLGWRASMILSLGLMTPSTGFILSSLKGYKFTESQEHWIRNTAISKELIAIFALFFILQTESLESFLISTGALVIMITVLPQVFKIFLKKIAPFAPDSEVSFLILIALFCGVITTKLGAYYLVGAFIVGMTAGRFKHFVSDQKSENMLYSVSFFFSFFVPFYFYKAGLEFPAAIFTLKGLGAGLILTLIFLPIRLLLVFSSIWFFRKEAWKDRIEISMSLLPTLIFGLVITSILRDRFELPTHLLSGLLIYTVTASIIPWFFLKKADPEPYDISFVRR
ncbi:MAG: cation:proton antiporter [Bdellovibrionales bacterium]|nr:cation:proton antiporter [Bdellovibrionales bacterium]